VKINSQKPVRAALITKAGEIIGGGLKKPRVFTVKGILPKAFVIAP